MPTDGISDLAAATATVEVARAALAERTATLDAIDAKIATTKGELAQLDGLQTVTTAQLTTIENLHRKLRGFDAERSDAAAAVATARSAVQTATREEGRVRAAIDEKEIAERATALEDEALAFVAGFRQKVADLQAQVRNARAQASACGIASTAHGGQWDLTLIGNADRPDFVKHFAHRTELIQDLRAKARAEAEDYARRVEREAVQEAARERLRQNDPEFAAAVLRG